MTKEIIIDGVNVAECQYFNKVFNEEPYCNIDEEHLYTCNSEPNCYFKQLQRLKKENEELKAEIDSCNDEFGCEQMAKYKQALEVIRDIAETPIIIDKNRFDEITNKIDEVLNEK